MKKIFFAICATFIILSSSGVSASAAVKTASTLQNYYSWAGIHIFSNGVSAKYETNGSKITSHGTPLYRGSTSIAWSSANESAGWDYKGTTSSSCYGQAKYVLGIATDKFSIGLQSVWKTDYASAKK